MDLNFLIDFVEPHLPWIIDVVVILVKVFVVVQVLQMLPIPLTWMERKVAGHIQSRLGPMRVGPHGILQPIADAIKLIFKEDIIPAKADKLALRHSADTISRSGLCRLCLYSHRRPDYHSVYQL